MLGRCWVVAEADGYIDDIVVRAMVNSLMAQRVQSS